MKDIDSVCGRGLSKKDMKQFSQKFRGLFLHRTVRDQNLSSAHDQTFLGGVMPTLAYEKKLLGCQLKMLISEKSTK